MKKGQKKYCCDEFENSGICILEDKKPFLQDTDIENSFENEEIIYCPFCGKRLNKEIKLAKTDSVDLFLDAWQRSTPLAKKKMMACLSVPLKDALKDIGVKASSLTQIEIDGVLTSIIGLEIINNEEKT